MVQTHKLIIDFFGTDDKCRSVNFAQKSSP